MNEAEELAHEPAGLAFRLFGRLTAVREGSSLDLGGPQQRSVLALLVLRHNEVVSNDRMLEVLWGDELPDNALQTLRVYVSRLRGILAEGGRRSGPDVLVTQPPGYKLAIRPARVDVHRFEQQVAVGRAALSARDLALAERWLSAALCTAAAPLLEDFLCEDFARNDRERLEDLRLLATEELIETRLELGRHREVVSQLRMLVTEHPQWEGFWRQLMIALYRCDRQGEALQAYRQAREWLATELGIDPGETLRRVEQLILVQDPALDVQTAAVHGAPNYVSSFVGDQDMVELARRVGKHRLVTLTGPGGIGKTRLAAEVVHTAAQGFSDGVWWVDLGALDRGADPASAVARSLAVRDVPGRLAQELVVGTLTDRNVLLVLDTCEHLVEEVARFAHRLLAAAPRVHILATSREPLRIASEHIWAVAPLDLPGDPGDPDSVLQCEAVRLLVSRARDALLDTGLREHVAMLADIAVRLDGLPLAIELAASRLRGMALSELARGLDDRFRLLIDGDRAAPPRHATLRAVLEWSFGLLEERERDLLCRLAVFPATFDSAAAEAVAQHQDGCSRDLAGLLVRLVDQSLVEAEVGHETTRYRLLDTVRAFGVERATPEQLTEARRRHAEHYLQLADALAGHMTGPDIMSWLARGHIEHDNFLSALHWLLERHEGDEALQLASSLGLFWYRIGYLGEGRNLLERALAAAAGDNERRAWGMVWRAGLVTAMGDPTAIELARRSVTYCERGGHLEPRAWALTALAFALLDEHRADDAVAAARRASHIFTVLDHPEGVANAQLQIGMACLQRGDVKAAAAHLNVSLESFRRMRGAHAGWVLVHLAEASLLCDDPDAAISWASQAVADFRQRKDPRGLAASFIRLGRAYNQMGETDRAAALLEQAAETAERWGYRSQAADASQARASLRTDRSLRNVPK